MKGCGMCWSRMTLPARWVPTVVVAIATTFATSALWLSPGSSSLAGLDWPWQETIPLTAAVNAVLLALVGLSYAVFRPSWRNPAGRPLLPMRARAAIFYVWLALNVYFYVGGILDRDFARKPGWLRQTVLPSASQHMSEPSLRLLRLLYNLGMAAAWPLLGNLLGVLLPVDRTLLLLAGLGVGHEDGVLAHALCGTAVWGWASVHAILTQLPMLAAGLWRTIVLPAAGGADGKGTSNFMGLLAWLCLCGLGLSSLAPLRRRAFDLFQLLHLGLAPAVFLFGCLHDSKVFWYGLLGAVLYGADLVQRWVLRRRTAIATATVYPLAGSAAVPPATAAAAAAASALRVSPGPPQSVSAVTAAAAAAAAKGCTGGGDGPGGSKFVVLRIQTQGPPGCCAGQHVFIRVPAVSRWEWHPYSVAAADGGSFAVVVKAGGDWERRLCRHVEAAAAASGGGGGSARLDLAYEGIYGTPDLQAAAAAADRVLLLAGGAGITPIASVLQALLLPQRNQWYGVGAATHPASAAAVAQGTNGHAAAAAASTPHGGISGAPKPQQLPQLYPQPPPHGAHGVPGAPGVGPWSGVGGEDAVGCGGALSAAPRVHLVWAVTQESDAQPLLPLLRAAADRGWAVDLHCTRAPQPAAPQAQVALVVNGGGMGALPPNGCAASNHHHAVTSKGAPASTKVAAVASPSPPPPPRPWQLHGAACWAVAAAAAAAGAVGRLLGSNAAVTYTCRVAHNAGDGGTASGLPDWVAGVRAAFASAASAAAVSIVTGNGAADTADGADANGAAADSDNGGAWRRLVRRVVASYTSAGACPAAFAPNGNTAHLPKGPAGAGSVLLRACSMWGQAEPELCVKCDPFSARSPLEEAWPCCRVPVCFYAVHLGPLVGWVVGAAAGATLACLVWRLWWRRRAAAAGVNRKVAAAAAAVTGAAAGKGVHVNDPLRQPLLGTRRVGDWLDELKAGGGGGGKEAAEAVLGDGGGGFDDGSSTALSAAEEGHSKEVEGPGLEAMLAALGYYGGGTTPGSGGGGTGGTREVGLGSSGGVVRVHVGRPDLEGYVLAASRRGGGGGGSSGAVVGVVVCGPESLQASVQSAFQRHLAAACPGSWFRGFSFTT